jgi:hypothetical protein
MQVQGCIFPNIFSFIFQSENEHDTTWSGTSKTITHVGSSATEVTPREMRYKIEALVDTEGENPDEEWPVRRRDLWTPLSYFEQHFWGLVAEQTNIRALQNNQKPTNATPM